MDVHAYWDAALRQDAAEMRRFFRPDAVICWPCTNERFTLEEYIRANCEYPGSWTGEVERIEERGGLIVTVTRVRARDGSCSCRAVSFIELRGGLVSRLDEYWADDGPAPEWRRAMRIGSPIIPER